VGAGKWIGGRINVKRLTRLCGRLFLVFGLFSLQQALG
jgi:putative Ca2+/H+ antiporter (TMEM165/GDT1 family)